MCLSFLQQQQQVESRIMAKEAQQLSRKEKDSKQTLQPKLTFLPSGPEPSPGLNAATGAPKTKKNIQLLNFQHLKAQTGKEEAYVPASGQL